MFLWETLKEPKSENAAVSAPLIVSAQGFVDKKFTDTVTIREEQPALSGMDSQALLFGQLLGEALAHSSLADQYDTGTNKNLSPSKMTSTICQVNGANIDTLQVGDCSITLTLDRNRQDG